jgi:hypothetical protein
MVRMLHDRKKLRQRLLFFRVDDFDTAVKKARAVVTRLEEELHAHPNTGVLAPGSGRITDPDLIRGRLIHLARTKSFTNFLSIFQGLSA